MIEEHKWQDIFDETIHPGMRIIYPKVPKGQMFEKLPQENRMIVVLKLCGFTYLQIHRYCPKYCLRKMKSIVRSAKDLYPEIKKWI